MDSAAAETGACAMKIVVTGSQGFIGQHLCQRLIDNSHQVIGLDIKTGQDILTCKFPEADLVFHLAAQVDASNVDAEIDAKINIMGLLRVLKAYESKVVFASSSAVNYPMMPYAISKAAGEAYCTLFRASVVRLCNIFGPGGHSVIDRFTEEQQLTIYGDGRQLRTFARVDEAVSLFMAELVERKPLRILHGENMSVLDIAAWFPDKPKVFAPPRRYDPWVGIQLTGSL